MIQDGLGGVGLGSGLVSEAVLIRVAVDYGVVPRSSEFWRDPGAA